MGILGLDVGIRADVAQRTVEVLDTVDTCPIGAAALALSSQHASIALADVVANVRRVAATFNPDLERSDIYDEAYGGYSALFRALAPMF